ncbi:sporulation integral membrane protein YtvI [Romboutsia weinsteinii]|uniref:Sporulation integral membrane protein YtvI n=1 Tax=Romboutsia weinsteinii TaxID=2020949 RepID=A0A371IZN7_9FIRM|nr:sporulation integral membrane protein YtvI [Romboutsia weinsteinii]RDY25969.1 sporulation integral membrane protein YtvI [Romboutsia weinsteinii]
MSVLNKNFLLRLKNNGIFFALYTISFIIISMTFAYISPFLIGGIIAFIISPISKKLKVKFRIDRGISTLILSFLAVALVTTVTSILVMLGTRHLMEFLNNLMENSNEINNMILDLVTKANIYIEHFQGVSNFNIEEIISRYSKEIIDVAKGLLTSVISLATSIPYIMIFTITLFISTYFIAKDIDKIEGGFYNIFTDNAKIKVKNIKREAISSIVGYIKAYTILMGITFLVIWGSFSLFGVPNGFILGFIGSLLDLIPFLGIIVIYLPVIIYYFAIKNYVVSIGLVIVFVGLSLLRQILEPKLVSVNIGLNPLATVAAIFIGVQIKGLIGIIFCLGFVAMHDILKKVEIL